MADNPSVRAGTAGGTIVVVADEITSPYTGDTAQAQGIKILDGLANSTTPARVTSSGELLTFQGNNGTVSVTGTPNVHITNAATVTLTGTNPVFVTNNGTVSVSSIAAGDNNIGNVDVVTLPGGITGFAEDAGHTTGDVGIQALAVRKNVAAALAGADADYTPLITDDVGAAWTHVNDGTVAIKGNVLVGNNGTVTLTGTNPVFVTNNGTVSVSSIAAGDNNIGNVDVVTLPGGITGFAEDAGHTTGDVGIQALAVRKNVAAALAGADADYTPLITDDLGAVWSHVNDGTVAIKGNVLVGNNGTVTLTGTNPVFVTNNGTVSVSSIAAGDNNIGNVDIVTLPGGITGFAEDAGHTTGDVGIQALAVRKNVAAALAGADADYTPLITDDVGAAWAHVNDGTVAIKGNVLVGNNGTVSVTGTPNVHITNAATVTATDLDIRNLTITNDAITKGSATIGLGYTTGGTNILLTASGTVVPSVSSRALYITHEAFTVQGGTITITARNGDGGGTLWGPMQFSPTGGIAASLPIEDGGLYETASGSAVYYVLSGSGTVGGRIRWARLAS